MKRNKIILAVLILSIIVLIFSGCGGSGVVPTVPSTPESSDDFVLIQVKDTESNISFIAGEKNGDTVTILGEKDSQGDPTKITGTLYVSEQGDAIFLEAGIDGLPTYIIDTEGNKITFKNYTNSTADIALYDSNENLIEGPITIDVNSQDLLEIKQFYDSSHLKQKYMPPGGEFIDVQFDWALSVLAFTNNNSGIIFDESGNPVDYIKPWEIEVNISDLLPEDNFIIIYEALLPVFIVDDLFDWVSFIWDVIAYIYQDGEDCFLGYWINEDANTPGITKIDIQKNNNLLEIYMWGKCHPTDCDWAAGNNPEGPAITTVDDADDGVLNIVWYPDFAIKTQEITYLGGDRLGVYTFTHFTDNSGRPDYERYDYFIKND